MNLLLNDLSSVRGVHPLMVEALNKKNIFNLFDLLHFFPKKYEDRSSLLKLKQAIIETRENKDFITTIISECRNKESVFFRERRVIKYFFSDGDDEFTVIAYNPYQKFLIGEYYILSGRLKLRYSEVSLNVSAYENFDEEAIKSIHLGRIVPIYHGGVNLNQKRIRKHIEKTLNLVEDQISYVFSDEIKKHYGFVDKKEALKEIHFPRNLENLEVIRKTLVYEEFYIVLKKIQEKRKFLKREKLIYISEKVIFDFLEKSPYELTPDQKKALEEIIINMKSNFIMNRLLQGDVGTGKTLVAFLSMFWVYKSGYQTLIMVPTEVLARQHYETMKKLFKDEEVEIIFLTGGHNKRYRDSAFIDFAYKEKLLIIGTHSLIQEGVKYKNLKYVIIDEQHRFGVDQRKKLLGKGKKVDFLSMTATPIPRSLSIILFGDMEISYLKIKPLSSSSVRTKLLMSDKRFHGYKFLFSRIIKGEQAYVVFPIIEESSNKKLTSLLKEYEKMKNNFFRSIPTGFIHGKKSPEEKEFIMNAFKKGDIKVLFSTTVLEVGIDHPNATIIIIESAYQFGLSQLHQLRGRVGRGNKLGYCYLISDESVNEKTKLRLEEFCHITDGFKIAELDLKIRGPGEILGLKQSGIPEFKLAHLSRDLDILEKVKRDFNKK